MVCRDKALVEYTIAAIVGIHTIFKSLSVTPHVYSIADMSRWKAFFSCAVNFLADTRRFATLSTPDSYASDCCMLFYNIERYFATMTFGGL